MLALSGIALAFVVVLLAVLFMCSKREISTDWLYSTPVWYKRLPTEFEADVQAALLDCANASGEEYIALRDALIPKARAKPEAFRFATALSPSWEQRLAGEIIMDYALCEEGVRTFIEWKKKPTPIKGRAWRLNYSVPGRDLANRARGAPMVLAEIIWKGTYELDSGYYPVHAAIALGNLRERRARELLEWLMLDIPDGINGSKSTYYIIIAETLGEIGAPESVPALLLAIEKGVYSNALLKCADESSLPFLRDAADNSMNEMVVSAARYHIMMILEARQGE